MRCTTRSIQLLIALLLLAGGSARADELYFKNGDRLSGKLLSLADGKIRFDSTLAGEVEVAVDQVRTLATDDPIEIHLSDETVLHDRALAIDEPSAAASMPAPGGPDQLPQGPVEPVPAHEPGGRYRVAGTSQVGPQSFALSDTVVINPPPEDPVDWSGRLTAGANVERGNSIGEEGDFSIYVRRKTDMSRITFRSSYEGDRDTDTSTGVASTSDRLIKGSLKYDFFLTDRLYLFQSTSAERDGVKALDLRLAIGAGTGYRWIVTDTLSFETELGLAWTDETYDDSALDNDFLTALLLGTKRFVAISR